MLRAIDAFNTMDMETTTQYQNELYCRGPEGQLAFGLFRAQKRSTKAKGYRKGSHRASSYAAKNDALKYVDAVLTRWGDELVASWGWKMDPYQEKHNQVLYVDFGCGYQCSFHSEVRHSRKEFDSDWNSSSSSINTVTSYCDQIMQQNPPESLDGSWLMPFGKYTGKPIGELEGWYVEWLCQWDGLEGWPNLRHFFLSVKPI